MTIIRTLPLFLLLVALATQSQLYAAESTSSSCQFKATSVPPAIAGAVYSTSRVDVREDCGAVGDGVADDTAAINYCIALVRQNGSTNLHSGGTIYFPRPDVHYRVSGELNFNNTYGIKLLGDQHGIGGNPPHGSSSPTAGLKAATIMFTQGGEGNLIAARSSNGFVMEGLVVAYNNSGFTGTVLNLSGDCGSETGHARIREVHLSGDSPSSSNARALISLGESLHISISSSYFMYARRGIDMASFSGSYVYNVAITDSTFIHLASAAIKDLGHLVTIRNCNFEPGGTDSNGNILSNNPTGIYVSDNAFSPGPVLIDSCFFGDGSGTPDVRPWIIYDGYNLTVSNSQLSTAGPQMEIVRIDARNGTNQNIMFMNNHFQGSGTDGAAIIRKTGGAPISVFTSINNFNPVGTPFLVIKEGIVMSPTYIPQP